MRQQDLLRGLIYDTMAVRKLTMRELAMIAIALDEEERENNRRSRRYWVHAALKKRKVEGEYWTLFRNILYVFSYDVISI